MMTAMLGWWFDNKDHEPHMMRLFYIEAALYIDDHEMLSLKSGEHYYSNVI